MIKLNVFMVVLALGSVCLAENKGFCPPPPPPVMYSASSRNAQPPASTDPDKKYFGTVTLLTVISDKGYVCSTHVLRGINKELDKKTEKAVKGWHFDPAQKDGHAVPVVISLDVTYWTGRTGEIISDPPQPKSSLSSEIPAH